jgi:hypothetical protein
MGSKSVADSGPIHDNSTEINFKRHQWVQHSLFVLLQSAFHVDYEIQIDELLGQMEERQLIFFVRIRQQSPTWLGMEEN